LGAGHRRLLQYQLIVSTGLETAEFSKGKTAVPVGGISVFVIVFALLAVALSSSAFFP
jgi:hypothetical protein